MPGPKLEELKKFSVSRNYYLQVVKPLYEDEKFQSKTALKKLLQDDLHKAFWRIGGPQPFDNALAGKFQEVLNCYRQVTQKENHAQLGSIAGIGGDTVTKAIDAEGEVSSVKTVQFKTVAAEKVEGVQENIRKAAWQLCGFGGEKPEEGSKRIIEVVLYRTHEYTSYTAEQWLSVVAEALSDPFTQNEKCATKKLMFENVDLVKITTPSARMKFKVNRNETVELAGQKETVKAGFIFDSGRLKQHWEWLRTSWWPGNVGANKDELIKTTIKKGIGAAGAYPKLPFQPS